MTETNSKAKETPGKTGTRPTVLFVDRGNGTGSVQVITPEGVTNYELTTDKGYTKKEMELERVESEAVGIDGRIEWTPKQERKMLRDNGYKPIKQFKGLRG